MISTVVRECYPFLHRYKYGDFFVDASRIPPGPSVCSPTPPSLTYIADSNSKLGSPDNAGVHVSRCEAFVDHCDILDKLPLLARFGSYKDIFFLMRDGLPDTVVPSTIYSLIYTFSVPLAPILTRHLRVCGVDMFESCVIDVRKKDIIDSCSFEDFVTYQAYTKRLITRYSFVRVVVSGIYGDDARFCLYWINNDDLLRISTGNMYFLDPFLLFSHVFVLDKSMVHYTILFLDSRTQAICNYSFGNLNSVCIKHRELLIENFLSEIENIGSMFSFSFTGDVCENSNFPDICTHYGIQKEHFLRILSSLHIYRNPLCFIAHRDFLIIRRGIMCVVFVLLIICVLLFLRMMFNTLIVSNLDALHHSDVQSALRKRHSYVPMYGRIYDNILLRKTRFFRLNQRYDGGEWVWES